MTTQHQQAFDLLGEASQRLVRTVDGLHDDDWTAPSGLPDWSRAHVVAHLALNAEGMARALRGVAAGDAPDEPRSMYDSDESRNGDIAELAAADRAELRARLLGAVTVLSEAIVAVPAPGWAERVERTPGGRTMAASSLPGMRLGEVEIHHADLDAGYGRGDWPREFSELLLDNMSKRVKDGAAFQIAPLDADGTWPFGEPADGERVPVVTGPAADLAWWLTGRGAPDTISSSTGELPTIGAW